MRFPNPIARNSPPRQRCARSFRNHGSTNAVPATCVVKPELELPCRGAAKEHPHIPVASDSSITSRTKDIKRDERAATNFRRGTGA